MKELHLKCRPKTFDEIIGQPDAVRTLKEMTKNKRIPHALLLSGPTGTGKTTTARILKKHLNCNDLDFNEINCADDRGIDMVRSMKQAMNLSPYGEDGSRIYVLDEVHQTTGAAQSGLLKALEDTPDHVYFILCTTDPNKLIPTVRNRCTSITFRLLTPKDMKTLLTTIVEKEKVEISEDVIDRIIETADGSARLGVNLLNRIHRLDNEEEQLDAILKSDSKRQSFDLVKALLWGKAKWPEVAKLISEIEEEPEGIRRLILANASKELLKPNNKNANKAYLIVSAFENDFFNSGRAGLVRACWEVVANKG